MVPTPEDISKVEGKLKFWSQQLHDLSGRNRLLFYKETRSSSATIESPNFRDLFRILVETGRELIAPLPPVGELDLSPEADELDREELEAEGLNLLQTENEILDSGDPDRNLLDSGPTNPDEPDPPLEDSARAGRLKKTQKPAKYEFRTNRSVSALNRILYNLRYLSRTVREEQGINILYITFGMLKWRELRSPDLNLAPCGRAGFVAGSG